MYDCGAQEAAFTVHICGVEYVKCNVMIPLKLTQMCLAYLKLV